MESGIRIAFVPFLCAFFTFFVIFSLSLVCYIGDVTRQRKSKMEIRMQKMLLKAIIDIEELFAQKEKDFMKLIVDMAYSTNELIVIVLFCCLECQRRGRAF